LVRSHLVTCVVALAAAGPALAGKAHEHGTARLDIAVLRRPASRVVLVR
jgi:hypothetical protein